MMHGVQRQNGQWLSHAVLGIGDCVCIPLGVGTLCNKHTCMYIHVRMCLLYNYHGLFSGVLPLLQVPSGAFTHSRERWQPGGC